MTQFNKTRYENPDLGDFSNPSKYHSAIDIDGVEQDKLLHMYESMLTIRMVEQHLAEMRKNCLIGGPIHLGVGQEAVAVGVSDNLKKSDRIFGAHRSHSHLIALGSSFYKLFAEVLGKETGHSKGMGGSMHLWDQPNSFYGSVPIVAGTVSLAVGAGMAAKLQKTNDVAVAYLGDGAAEEGVVHESLNLARIQDAPVLFVVENNLFASHMHISLRQPSDAISRFAKANDIPYKLIDGNDVVSLSKAAHELITQARQGRGPGMIEAVTYRWYGHVDWRDDLDVGVHRSLSEVSNWKARDPVLRLSNAMKSADMWDNDQEQQLNEELDKLVQNSWVKAMNDPYPELSATMERVYA